jgi:CBS-domain-containing membrane protein
MSAVILIVLLNSHGDDSFHAIPVVDDREAIVGVIPYRDVMEHDEDHNAGRRTSVALI